MIAITGATGNLGSLLSKSLRERGESVRALGRGTSPPFDLAKARDHVRELESALAGVKILVHAGWDLSTRPLEARARINTEGSTILFKAAREAGVGRIVFLSSIVARSDSRSSYGRAKLEVEKMLEPKRDLALRVGWVVSPRRRIPLAGMLAMSPVVRWLGAGNELLYPISEGDFVNSATDAILGKDTGLIYLMGRSPVTLPGWAIRFGGRLVGLDPQKLDSLADLRRIDIESGLRVLP